MYVLRALVIHLYSNQYLLNIVWIRYLRDTGRPGNFCEICKSIAFIRSNWQPTSCVGSGIFLILYVFQSAYRLLYIHCTLFHSARCIIDGTDIREDADLVSEIIQTSVLSSVCSCLVWNISLL